MTDFLIEVVPAPETVDGVGLRPRSLATKNVAAATKEVGEAIAESCRSVFASVQSSLTESMPDTLELSFGVSISAEGGIPLVGKAGTESTFLVKAVWNK